MKLASIVPGPYVIKYASDSDFHLVLAHAIRDNAIYRNSYKSLPIDDTIIMDNSSYELGDNWCTPEELFDIADMVGATAIMAPETFPNSKDTVKKVDTFLTKKSAYRDDKKVFAVMHGETLKDIKQCHTAFISMKVDIIGISCRTYIEELYPLYSCHEQIGPILQKKGSLDRALNRMFLIRSLLYKKIQTPTRSNRTYHLLGLNNPLELGGYKDFPMVKSNDSSSAWVHGIENRMFESNALLLYFQKSKVPINLEQSGVSEKLLSVVDQNIQFLYTIVESQLLSTLFETLTDQPLHSA